MIKALHIEAASTPSRKATLIPVYFHFSMAPYKNSLNKLQKSSESK